MIIEDMSIHKEGMGTGVKTLPIPKAVFIYMVKDRVAKLIRKIKDRKINNGKPEVQ